MIQPKKRRPTSPKQPLLPSVLRGVGGIVSVFPNTGHTSIKVENVLCCVTQAQCPWCPPQTSALQPQKQAQEKRVSYTLHQTDRTSWVALSCVADQNSSNSGLLRNAPNTWLKCSVTLKRSHLYFLSLPIYPHKYVK